MIGRLLACINANVYLFMYNPVEMWCLTITFSFTHIDITESTIVLSSLNIRCPELRSSDSFDGIDIFHNVNIKTLYILERH
jgi:hypothetical protein